MGGVIKLPFIALGSQGQVECWDVALLSRCFARACDLCFARAAL